MRGDWTDSVEIAAVRGTEAKSTCSAAISGSFGTVISTASGSLYGRKFATTNYGLLYTAKGTASLLVPLANVLQVATGNWKAVFLVAAALNIVAAVMALVVLKPMRTRTMSRS